MRFPAFLYALVAASGLALVTVSGSSGATRSGVALTATVRVVRCRTVFGVSPGKITTPSHVTVLGSPRSTANLVAYSNTEQFLIGPSGMACSGLVAADGNTSLIVWPRRNGPPGQHAHEAALTLTSAPACAACRAEEACPFFPAYARRLHFPCSSGIPPGEIVERVHSHLVLFEDPPGVAGDGWPSGGLDPANGLAVIHGSFLSSVVYRSTCTLPASKHSTCSTSLNDVLRRYG